MSQTRTTIPRPKRWDVPFSDKMTDSVVQRILSVAPFKDIDRAKFSKNVSLEGIIKNDARLLVCQAGDIIIREGDWGNSAFFILSGAVRVELMAAVGDRLREPFDAGLAEVKDGHLRLTEHGRLLGNEVFVRLLPD